MTCITSIYHEQFLENLESRQPKTGGRLLIYQLLDLVLAQVLKYLDGLMLQRYIKAYRQYL